MGYSKISKSFLLIIMVLLLNFGLLSVDALSYISSVNVEPEKPTNLDNITIRVDGSLPDGCWGYGSGDYSINNNQINIALYTYDGWMPGLACPLIVVDYSAEFNIGQLESGEYLINITEIPESLRYPLPDYYSYELFVAPTECSTWADVISKYNAYVSEQAQWSDVITCYQQYASSQYTISGTVSDNAYVLMELSGPVTMTTETHYDGSYSFTGLSNGTYTVTPSKSVCPDCYSISPSSQTVTINEASISGVDFSPMCVPCDLVSTHYECFTCMYICYLSGECSLEEYESCYDIVCSTFER
jgi:hypothetical protein